MIGQFTEVPDVEKGLFFKCVVAFVAVNVLMTVGGAVIISVFELEMNTGVRAAIAIMSAYVAGVRFVNISGCEMQKEERWKLTVLCLLASFVVSFFQVYFVDAMLSSSGQDSVWSMVAEMPYLIVAIAIVLALTLHAWMTWFGLGLGVKQAIKGLNKT